MLSLPSRERGLKFGDQAAIEAKMNVAPFAGAWIEIILFRCRQILVIVAPFAGAWIEIVLLAHLLLFQHRRSLRGSVD